MDQWLDAVQDSGDLPGDAEAAADRVRSCDSRLIQKSADDTRGKPMTLPQVRVRAILPAAIAVLQEQLSLLVTGGDGAEGRMASAGRLAANVLQPYRTVRRREAN